MDGEDVDRVGVGVEPGFALLIVCGGQQVDAGDAIAVLIRYEGEGARWRDGDGFLHLCS